jgi:hypothetical protein
MRNRYSRILLILLLPFLTSCWWWGARKRDPEPNYPISGAKWHEVKLWVYHKAYDGFIFADTTYQRAAFDTLDYVQFFNNGSLKIASHVYYPFDSSGKFSDPPAQYYSYTDNFVLWRSLYLVNRSGLNADTVFYNGSDSLRIHSFYNNNLYYDEADAYYTR